MKISFTDTYSNSVDSFTSLVRNGFSIMRRPPKRAPRSHLFNIRHCLTKHKRRHRINSKVNLIYLETKMRKDIVLREDFMLDICLFWFALLGHLFLAMFP